ncbi:hypothetical protein [Magnetococcus sp. PR-3]|uniref:hypothetical protein n=1 Tax=Magnetococcus sp. PR-3 TaxID=3120355 RepID=UPI002FCE4BFE
MSKSTHILAADPHQLGAVLVAMQAGPRDLNHQATVTEPTSGGGGGQDLSSLNPHPARL